MIKTTNLFKIAVAAILFSTLFLSENSKAQTVNHDSQNIWRLGFGIEPGVVVGGDRDFYHYSLGGAVRLQYDIKGNLSLMLSSGYTNLFALNQIVIPPNVVGFTYTPKDYGIIPVKAGAKVFFAPHAYASAEAGAGFETRDNGLGEKDVKLILAPGIGYATNSGIDFSIRYDNYSGQGDTFGVVALRIAYGFKL